MSDSPPELDLKFLPDWLKESPGTNRYADYQGEGDDRPRRDRDDRSPRGPRPGGGGPRREGDRRGPGGPRSGPPGDRARGPRPGGNRPPGGRDDRRHDDRPPREAPRPAPAGLRVEILPEPNAAAGIAKQIKSSGRAYPIFGTSKLFLDRPERHRVRLTSTDAAVPLFQIGDGPISFDRAVVERDAFFTAKSEFYSEETIQGEPIKGNFSNVARARATGALLGPTNHHGYQPALRKLYEERFSRRMSFQEFQQSEIVTVTDEQTIAEWKEQARTSTTFATTKEAEPITFKTLFDTEQHFRKHYLPTLVKSGPTLECSGQAARAGGDRHIGGAVREAWEAESRFPQQIVNGLRPFLMEVGLHFFKHRKRVLFVSATKPLRHPAGQVFSDGITAILRTVEASPRIKRPELAVKIIGAAQDTPEAIAQKAQLAADLHYLIHIGHVIEFSDGALELPLPPFDKPPQERAPRPAPVNKSAPAPVAESATANAAVEDGASGETAAQDAAPDDSGPAEATAAELSQEESAPEESAGADESLRNAEELAPIIEDAPVEETAAVDDSAAGLEAAVDAAPEVSATLEESLAAELEETPPVPAESPAPVATTPPHAPSDKPAN